MEDKMSYLSDHGIDEKSINKFGLVETSNKVTIPIRGKNNEFLYNKYRHINPKGWAKFSFDRGSHPTLFNSSVLTELILDLVICEGEPDCIRLDQEGINAVCGTGGAMLFPEEWVEQITTEGVFICMDNDPAGVMATTNLIDLFPKARIISLPEGYKDICEYFKDYTKAQFIELMRQSKTKKEWEKEHDENAIDISQFKPLTVQELIEILGLTIKKDNINKVIAFFAQLSAYTEDSQINVSFNAPSSSGKSYIPLEVSNLFPSEDVIKLGVCSPTAFYHEQGEYDKETNTIIIDLSRKIIIFLDQPSTLLLERLRSLLSHDEKEIRSKITDKNQKGGNRTKNVIIRGFPAVIFCTTGLNLDDQEATRFLLLSPEINQDKIKEAIKEKIKKGSDTSSYINSLEADPRRRLLRDRISAIKSEQIANINIKSPELIDKMFFERTKELKPRYQRDIARIMSLTKISALLNLWFREKHGATIIANEEDINIAFKIWDAISESQELNLPPYLYDFYKKVILELYEVKQRGLTKQEIIKKHSEVFHRYLPDWEYRQQIIPPLEAAGLISLEPDKEDKRKILVYPTTPLTNSPENNSE